MPNRVKEFREEAGLSQEELANMSGVSRNTISLIETAANPNVTYKIMYRLANALKKKVGEVFFED
ncbi:MAG: helix-turn-helix domain-containing protein [Clostridia bacterium]|nr:helix-turn-helix domain-containing protein [Clostridia bacterium]